MYAMDFMRDDNFPLFELALTKSVLVRGGEINHIEKAMLKMKSHDNKFTLFHQAIKDKKHKYLKSILDLARKLNVSVDPEGTEHDITPLQFALGLKDIKAMEMLIDYGADATLEIRGKNLRGEVEAIRILSACRHLISFVDTLVKV